MPDTTRPPKELVREYFESRTHAPLEPPPTPDEIRRLLGWHLLPATRQPDLDVGSWYRSAQTPVAD